MVAAEPTTPRKAIAPLRRERPGLLLSRVD
jgi:hypothetical protein